MIGAAIGNTLSTIVINVLSSCVYEGKQKAVDTVKLNKLKIEIDEWIEDYCRENDGSILTSSAFQNYVCYQNTILKIYTFSPIFPLVGSVIGGFYWLFLWNFKEIKHQPFSITQPFIFTMYRLFF